MAGPLEGYRIIDLTAFIAGPLASMILGDQGAQVIKIEPPGAGDVMRYMGTGRGGLSALFASCNRSKRSVVLNLREARGRELLEQLTQDADVFMQNFRPGVVERLGIEEAHMRELNPRLIYVSISAFGHEGRCAKRRAFDNIIQAMAGSPAVQADPEKGKLCFVGQAMCDKVTAYTGAQSITAALLARGRGAGGQHLRLAMLDAAIAFMWPDGMTNHMILEDDVPEHPSLTVAYRMNATADGHVAVAPITDPQVHGLFRAAGREDLIEDPRFATVQARFANLRALIEEVRPSLEGLSNDELLERLSAEDVPCGPVLSLDEVPTHPQVQANETLVETQHPQMGRLRQPRPPVRFEATPAEIRRPAPALGAHTDEVLQTLGLSSAELVDLRAKGIVG